MQEIRESHIYHNGIPDWIEFWDSNTNETTRYVPERTCHLETNCHTCSKCSECGHHVWHVYNYCPSCGAKVVE